MLSIINSQHALLGEPQSAPSFGKASDITVWSLLFNIKQDYLSAAWNFQQERSRHWLQGEDVQPDGHQQEMLQVLREV